MATISATQFEKRLIQLSDRAFDVRSFGNDLLDAWGFDLEARRPGVAYVTESGTQVTSLDMACLLSTLCEWGSVINLPVYKSLGPKTRKEGQIITSAENRHGKILSLVSNADTFNFSVRIMDMNVMTAHDVGDFRHFLMFVDGDWYDGWKTITFQPTEKEKELLAKIPSNGNTIVFDSFVSPLRWPSFYGRHYVLAKALIERLKDQNKHLGKQVAEIKKALNIEPKKWPAQERVGETKPRSVWKLNVEVLGLSELHGTYKTFPSTKAGLEDAEALLGRLKAIKERLAFQTRATEFAFFKRVHGLVDGNDDAVIPTLAGETAATTLPTPAWIDSGAWELGWRQSNRHKPVARLTFNETIALHLKIGRKTIQVAA